MINRRRACGGRWNKSAHCPTRQSCTGSNTGIDPSVYPFAGHVLIWRPLLPCYTLGTGHVLYHSLILPLLALLPPSVLDIVVILFRHSAYDVCGSVTADVTFPIGAINKPSAAMACCGLHSCPNKQFNQFVWINLWEPRVQWHDFESLWTRRRKKKKVFTLRVCQWKSQRGSTVVLFFFPRKVYSTLRPSQRRLFIPRLLLFFPTGTIAWHQKCCAHCIQFMKGALDLRGEKKCVFHF